MQDFIITPDHIKRAGITIADTELQDFLEYTNEQLDERVGEVVTELLDDEQLEELLALQESASEDVVYAWLQQNLSELDQIVQDEISILLADIAEERDAINSPK